VNKRGKIGRSLKWFCQTGSCTRGINVKVTLGITLPRDYGTFKDLDSALGKKTLFNEINENQ